MNKSWMVARWEYIEKIKSKAFIISLILTPLLMVGMGVVPSLLALKEDSDSRVIGIIDQSGQLINELNELLAEKYTLKNGKPNYVLLPITFSGDIESSKKEADRMIIKEEIEGCLIIGRNILTDTLIEYRSQNVGNIKLTERMNRAVRDIVTEKKLKAEGLDPNLIKKFFTPIELKGIKLSKDGKEEEAGFESIFFTAYGFMMMMFILVLTSGQMLVRSMLEEKSNRVVEVLMSSCSPSELMAGKIIGLSGLGLTQIVLWAIFGAVLSLKFGSLPITLSHSLLTFVYFILGYVFYSAVFVTLGAPISTEQEAQQVTSYITMILIMPIMFAFAVLQNPNSMLAKILSFFPLTTPTMMALRIPIQTPDTWELIVTMIIMVLSSVGMMWIAGKIFRTTILLTGKRPSLMELIQIVRAK
ncbi:MAG: ABC transporter permease [Ignavibacteriae bacterium]|nr:ABC transporter permease [Ignavibacteriota bacterium]